MYEGCKVPLSSDGRLCALGATARKNHLDFPTSPIGKYSRVRGGAHVCSTVDSGTWFFNFAVQVEDVVLLVWEKNGVQLMEVSGAEFREAYGTDKEKIGEACDEAMSKVWTVTYLREVLPAGVIVYRPVSFICCPSARVPDIPVVKVKVGGPSKSPTK